MELLTALVNALPHKKPTGGYISLGFLCTYDLFDRKGKPEMVQ
jgi:hypothetical protein